MTDTSSCSECGAPFTCGRESGSCWCAEYPAIMPADFTRGCRCPDCLSRAIGRMIEKRLSSLGHAEAIKLASSLPPSLHPTGHTDLTEQDGP